jgi:hypothetical protein
MWNQRNRELVILIQFVRNIQETLKGTNGKRYTRGTDLIRQELLQLAKATINYLDNFADQAPSDSEWEREYWKKLIVIFEVWKILHPISKCIVDADTLAVPYPFIEWSTARLREVPELGNSEIALCNQSEFKFIQFSLETMRDRTRRLKDLISEIEPLSEHVALIGFPFVAANSLSLGSLLTHELGHFCLQKGRGAEIQAPVVDLLVMKINTTWAEHQFPSTLDNGNIAVTCRSTLGSWVQEILCDLFAVWFSGPIFSYAFIEFLAINTPSDSLFAKGSPNRTFHPTHPADAFRLRLQLKFATSLGWDVSALAQFCGESFEFDKQDTQAYDIDCERIEPSWVKVYRTCADILRHHEEELLAAGTAIVKDLDSGASHYVRFQDEIQKYLSYALVPSTVIQKSQAQHPGGVALLNAGHQFLLSRCEDLFNRVPHKGNKGSAFQAEWISRAESWVMKSLEDSLLLKTKPL